MGMGLLLRRAYPAYATPGQYGCRPTRRQACTSRPTLDSISLHFDLVYIKHINVMNQKDQSYIETTRSAMPSMIFWFVPIGNSEPKGTEQMIGATKRRKI